MIQFNQVGRRTFILDTIALLGLILLSASMHAQKGHSPVRVYDDSVRPEVRISVEALGYRAPGVLPSFSFYALVNVQYIDANHLLFTFNTPGLLKRDSNCSDNDSERMVRAVVLDIPSGKIEKQATWKLYDFMDFLWNLRDGQFLLRNCSQLERVDASLIPQEFIRVDGSLEDIILSPDRSMILVEAKPPPPAAKPQSVKAAGSAPAHPTASLPDSHAEQQLALDFIRLHPLGIVARSRAPDAVNLPIMGESALEVLAAPKNRWDVGLQPLHGALRHIVSIHSTCTPELTAITDNVFVANTCPKPDESMYQGYNLQGTLLWQFPLPTDLFFPRFILGQNGAHFAIETLHETHLRAALDPIDPNGVDKEMITVFDTLTGTLIASFVPTPIYTAGSNVDFSPDGVHMAILHDGAIEIYDLNAVAKAQPASRR